jgi:hypothetical protein
LEPKTSLHPFAYMWTSARAITSAKRICILYEKGPLAIRAYSPSGLKGQSSELWGSIEQLAKESRRDLGQAIRQFGEDI